MFGAMKGAAAAWATFWLGVVAAIITAVVASWQTGLVVFAVGLGLTVILAVLAFRRGAKSVKGFVQDVERDLNQGFNRPGTGPSLFN